MLANYIVVQGVLGAWESVESKQNWTDSSVVAYSVTCSRHGGNMRETSKVRPCQMEATTTAPGSGLVDGLTSSLCQGYVCVYIYICFAISWQGHIHTYYNRFLLANMITRWFHMTHAILMIIIYIYTWLYISWYLIIFDSLSNMSSIDIFSWISLNFLTVEVGSTPWQSFDCPWLDIHSLSNMRQLIFKRQWSPSCWKATRTVSPEPEGWQEHCKTLFAKKKYSSILKGLHSTLGD